MIPTIELLGGVYKFGLWNHRRKSEEGDEGEIG